MQKQQGAALMMSLIFLLVLTIIGVASLNDTIMQGKMAGAMQDGNIALQGTETAIRDAEELIDDLVTMGDFGVAAGLYLAGTNIDPFSDALWTADNSIAAPLVAGLKEAPRYVIKQAGQISVDDSATSLNINTYSHESGSGVIFGFRIIARSTGASGNSQRIVESFYGKRF